MKRISLFVLFIISLSTLHAQDDYQRYMDSVNRAMKQMVEESKNELQQIQKNYKSFIEERNAEFAEFIANEWKLFEDFKAHQLSMTMPKLKNMPSAKEKALTDAQSSIEFASSIDLPKITHATATEYNDERITVIWYVNGWIITEYKNCHAHRHHTAISMENLKTTWRDSTFTEDSSIFPSVRN